MKKHDGTQVPTKGDSTECDTCVRLGLYEMDGRCPIDGGSCWTSRESDYFWTAILLVVVFILVMVISMYLAWRW